MKQILLSGTLPASALSLGFWRVGGIEIFAVQALLDAALESGVDFLDTADIYAGGESERLLGAALKAGGLRERFLIQTKCGIRPGQYDFSKEHILNSVDGSLKRLGVDYIDALLLHRPDTLVEPEEVAEAFSLLHRQGKVRYFGVSNHKPMQAELLQRALPFRLIANQLQFSLANTTMLGAGLHANMELDDALDRDGSVLDYCRLHNLTVQVWSPLQYGVFAGTFLDNNEKYAPLNKALDEMAQEKGVTKAALAIAWILRHPANMQVISGTCNPQHLREAAQGCDITISRKEWYALYLAAGNTLP